MRILALALVFSLLSACSMFSSLPSGASYQDEFTAENGYAYGHGVAATKEQALSVAQANLAEQISVNVFSEFTEAKSFSSYRGGSIIREQSRDEAKSFVSNYTSVQLQGIHKQEHRVKEGWYVRVKLPNEALAAERQRMNRQAAALAYMLLIAEGEKNGASTSELLSYAIRGIDKAIKNGISDEILYARGVDANTTFDAYFKETIAKLKRRILLLPITSGHNLSFAIIEQDTYEPQRNFSVQANNLSFETNRRGISQKSPFIIMANSIRTLLLGDAEAVGKNEDLKNLLRGEILDNDSIKNPIRSNIYVHTVPAGSQVVLLSGTETLDTQTSPAKFSVKIGTPNLRIQVKHQDKTYRDTEEIIGTASSPNYYFSAKLTENTFGKVKLSVPGNNLIQLSNLSGQVVADKNDHIEAELEVGAYRIKVMNRSMAEKYQRVDDEIRIFQDQELNRKYFAPIDRQYYNRGRSLDFYVGYVTPPNGERTFKINKDTELTYDALNQADFEADSLMIGLRGISLTNSSLAFSLSLDYQVITFENDKEYSDNKFALTSLGASAGMGFWTSKLLGEASWITANYNHSYNMWGSGLTNQGQKAEDYSSGYAFLDIGARWEFYGFGIRLADPKEAGSSLYLSIGSTTRKTGYQYASDVSASENIHYR